MRIGSMKTVYSQNNGEKVVAAKAKSLIQITPLLA
jgi:hypothetical protein